MGIKPLKFRAEVPYSRIFGDTEKLTFEKLVTMLLKPLDDICRQHKGREIGRHVDYDFEYALAMGKQPWPVSETIYRLVQDDLVVNTVSYENHMLEVGGGHGILETQIFSTSQTASEISKDLAEFYQSNELFQEGN